jgi:uncharacterized protein YgiM (DUF1202 family)
MTKSLRFTHTTLIRIVLSLSLIGVALAAFAAVAGPADAAPADALYCRAYHTVQRGETLYKIGLKYNLTWDKIAKANNIANPNKIYAGQVLCIPGAAPAATPTARPPATPTPGPITVIETPVKYALALTDVNIRVGPSMEHAILGKVAAGQIAKVTGLSADGLWWRVICPDGSVGSCWITARPKYTIPTNAP